MLNFRQLKKDFSPAILKDGKTLFDEDMVESVKIVSLTGTSVRVACRVKGNYDNSYESELEIDRSQSCVIDSDCDCPYNYDCQHLAAVLHFLEKHLDQLIVDYSKEAELEDEESVDESERKELEKTFQEAKTKEKIRRGKKRNSELLQEYVFASKVLGRSPFFLPEEHLDQDKAELAILFNVEEHKLFDTKHAPEIQLALRIPNRSKPLHVLDIKEFLDGVRFCETIYIGSRRYFFGYNSFDPVSTELLRLLIDHIRLNEQTEEPQRTAHMEAEAFGTLLARSYDMVHAQGNKGMRSSEGDANVLPCLYCGSLESPLRYSPSPVSFHFSLEYLEAPEPKILLNPSLAIGDGRKVRLEDAGLLESAKPGVIYENTYYPFHSQVRRKHLRHLNRLREVTIPEPLFGTFVENSLQELSRFAEVSHEGALDHFVTLPYVGELQAVCDISYLDGELDAQLYFNYDGFTVPIAASQLKNAHIDQFVTDQGILARDLTEEQKIIDDLFQDFVFDPKSGYFKAKTEKKVVEFMTEVVPRNQHRVTFNCPENLLDQFIFDETRFTLNLKSTKRVDTYQAHLTVDGHLKGVTVDQLWDCLSAKRPFIELHSAQSKKGKGKRGQQPSKILVLNLAELAPVVQIFDELGIETLEDHSTERPLWSLANISSELFDGLPIEFSMSKKLKEVQEQMLGMRTFKSSKVPKDIRADLRNYQVEGVEWLERLRNMHLSGILADDMGLGKTVQAITAITQYKKQNPDAISLVVCPTSLVYNWVAEFSKFNPDLTVLPIDGTPAQRKKLLKKLGDVDVVVTSYSLLQKDIEIYQKIDFAYAVLDEAQHIKNRGTRNAKSVKQVQARHRLILTGTPIENSLEELWSLFDFLLPGLLSSYDRFVEKYVRQNAVSGNDGVLHNLRNKVSPFILRRMKKDILQELPPVSENVYHCHLSEKQRELYRSYADSAREELSKLVQKEGFDKVQIHVLATLTRLKQICCHPAIFAKDIVEGGDSAKYDMLLELLETLIEGKHKVVIFSQYTRMLKIMREDLERMGVPFCYLDGSTKDRMGAVNKFNEDPNIPVFLVSLKAGGSGLNLTGADTVIHYDMWWNPAVESQATDRVHRIGQTSNVSSYKLVTVDTIEEKIMQLQDRKRGLVKQIVDRDEEAVTKLTWEEVLELLQV